MKLSWFASLLLAVIAGASGAWIVTGATGSAPTFTPEQAQWHELVARVDDLRDQNRRLLDALQQLADRPTPAADRSDTSSAPLAAQVMRTEVVATASEDPAGSAARQAPGELKQTVGEILSEIREQEAEERSQRKQEKRQLAFERELQRIAGELDLTEYQSAEMRRILLAEAEKMQAARAAARDTDSDGRGSIGAVRDETRVALAQFLSADQLASFEQRWGSRRGLLSKDARSGKGPKQGANAR